MKILQVVPRSGNTETLKSLLNATERRLRVSSTTFSRQRAGRWRHKTYNGRVNWEETRGGIVVAEVHSRVKDMEWQLLQAFVGYLERHLGRHLESVTINFR